MAKDRKRKVPKRIAGVKVPKKLRKTAAQALDLAANPAARQLAAAALGAAAAALAAGKPGQALRREVGEAAGHAREQAADFGREARNIVDTVRDAALGAMRGVLDAVEAEMAKAEDKPSSPAPDDNHQS